jgi:SNF2 family DNA or RNA helicase
MLELIPKLGGYVQVAEKVKEFRNLEELHRKIAPYSHRVLKEECLDLRPKVYEPRDVDLTLEQIRAYDELRRYATTMLDDQSHVTAESVITQMIRLHQIVCGHVVDEDGVIKDVRSNRVAAVLDVLEDHGGKAIVWAHYQHEVRKIHAALTKEYGPRSAALYYGGNKRGRVDDEKRFLGDSECRFMVSSQGSGGLGNNWTVADLVVYAASTHDLELRMQSEDRAHRKGQTRSVTYVDLIARGTVEEKIIQALRKKLNLADIINGENFRQWLI